MLEKLKCLLFGHISWMKWADNQPEIDDMKQRAKEDDDPNMHYRIPDKEELVTCLRCKTAYVKKSDE